MLEAMDKAVKCVACGGDIMQQFGRYGDFCSPTCLQRGRMFCKFCDKLLSQPEKGTKKLFCDAKCGSKYHYRGGASSSLLEERQKSTCKGCGKSITQPRTGGVRKFCTEACMDLYYQTASYGYSITDAWGNYAPETRKVLLELQSLNLPMTAQRLAMAIDREYRVRRKSVMPSQYVSYHCKTCSKEFRRNVDSKASRDYCSPRCEPNHKTRQRKRATILTWKEINEIRLLYETGQFSKQTLSLRYSVCVETIKNIVTYQTWAPEGNERYLRKGGAWGRFTWEQVDEIRALAATKQLTQKEIGRRYNVSWEAINGIVNCRTWKPEDDPRKAMQSHD